MKKKVRVTDINTLKLDSNDKYFYGKLSKKHINIFNSKKSIKTLDLKIKEG